MKGSVLNGHHILWPYKPYILLKNNKKTQKLSEQISFYPFEFNWTEPPCTETDINSCHNSSFYRKTNQLFTVKTHAWFCSRLFVWTQTWEEISRLVLFSVHEWTSVTELVLRLRLLTRPSLCEDRRSLMNSQKPFSFVKHMELINL